MVQTEVSNVTSAPYIDAVGFSDTIEHGFDSVKTCISGS